MRQYLAILRKALEEGDERRDRTGVGTRAVFGELMRFRMSEGFPAVTTKRLAFRSVVAELLWFLAGSSDVRELNALGVHIWDGNAFADYWRERARFAGDAGRNYGQQWRDWNAPDGRHIEQLGREPFPSPSLWLDPGVRGVDDAVARYRDILARVGRGESAGPLLDGFAHLEQYQHHPPIKAKMAV